MGALKNPLGIFNAPLLYKPKVLHSFSDRRQKIIGIDGLHRLSRLNQADQIPCHDTVIQRLQAGRLQTIGKSAQVV